MLTTKLIVKLKLVFRYLVTDKFKVYQFTHQLRKRINLRQDEALYLFINGKVLLKSGNSTIFHVFLL